MTFATWKFLSVILFCSINHGMVNGRILGYPRLPYNKTITSYLEENITISIPIDVSNILQLQVENTSGGCCVVVNHNETMVASICQQSEDNNITGYSGSLQIKLKTDSPVQDCGRAGSKTTLRITVLNKCIGSREFVEPGSPSYSQPCRYGNDTGCTLAICQSNGSWTKSRCEPKNVSYGTQCGAALTSESEVVTQAQLTMITTDSLEQTTSVTEDPGTTGSMWNGSVMALVTSESPDTQDNGKNSSGLVTNLKHFTEVHTSKDKVATNTIALGVAIAIFVLGVGILLFMILRLLYRTKSKKEAIQTVSAILDDNIPVHSKTKDMSSGAGVTSSESNFRVKNPCYISINGDFSESNTDDDVSQTSNVSSEHKDFTDSQRPHRTSGYPEEARSHRSKAADSHLTKSIYNKKSFRDVKVHPHARGNSPCTFTKKNGCMRETFCVQGVESSAGGSALGHNSGHIYAVSYKKQTFL